MISFPQCEEDLKILETYNKTGPEYDIYLTIRLLADRSYVYVYIYTLYHIISYCIILYYMILYYMILCHIRSKLWNTILKAFVARNPLWSCAKVCRFM